MTDENKVSFRDRLTTVSSEGKRVWVYPKKPKGRFYNKRRIVAVILLLFLFVTPFIRYKGEPLMLFNIIERKFIFFGNIFYPQDFYLVVLCLISLVVFIILFTVIYGRLFCGWVCPQTIFMEFVFRQIEYWIEGDFHKQKKLARQEWNFEKIRKKSLKHIIFFALAFITANTFVAWLIGIDHLKLLISDGPVQHAGSFTAVVLFSGAFYFIFAFFREQVCTIACPYGRLQGVLLDEKSVVVAYDYIRGEPKAKYNPLEDRKVAAKGDCIDCLSCVTVCPTNIDIRNGTQLECINCTACMDACDAIMDKMKTPRGLIRYDSEKGISEGRRSILNPRSIAYSAVLIVLLAVVGTLFAFRGDFETTILRQQGTLFQEYGEDSYSNIYQVEVVNKTHEVQHVNLKLLEPHGKIVMMGDPVVVGKGDVGTANFLVVINKDELESSKTEIKIGIFSGDKKIDDYEVTFIGPNSLDKHERHEEHEEDKDHDD